MACLVFSHRRLKALLAKEMRAQLTPALEQMGFQTFRKREGDAGFQLKYYRVNPTTIDVINFQWRTYGRPKFIIDFHIIENKDKYTPFPRTESERWFDRMDYRAQANPGSSERWFKIGLLGKVCRPEYEARRVVGSALARLREVDRYMREGVPSPYLTGGAPTPYRGVPLVGKARPRKPFGATTPEPREPGGPGTA